MDVNNLTVGGIQCGFGNLLGFKQAGFEVKFLVDDRPFMKKSLHTLNHHFGLTMKNFVQFYKDLEELNLPKVDVILSSPSCAQFSKLGMKRKDRKNLSEMKLEEFDMIKALFSCFKAKPSAIIMEYVPDILRYVDLRMGGVYHLTSNQYIPFEEEYSSYYCLLNTLQYGIPQKRERLFLFLIRKEAFKVYSPPLVSEPPKTVGQILTKLEELRKFGALDSDEAPAHSEERIEGFRNLKEGESYYGTMNNMRLYRDHRAPVITSSKTQYVHPWHPRVMTPRELACFQGFPIDCEFKGTSFSNKCDLIGKTVSPVIMKDIAEFLIQAFKEEIYRRTDV